MMMMMMPGRCWCCCLLLPMIMMMIMTQCPIPRAQVDSSGSHSIPDKVPELGDKTIRPTVLPLPEEATGPPAETPAPAPAPGAKTVNITVEAIDKGQFVEVPP
jgi:hypothetical protein